MSHAADRFPRLGRRAVAAYAFIFIAVPILTYFTGRFLDRTFWFPAFPPFPLNLTVGFTVFIFGLAIGIKSTRLLYLKGRGLPWGAVKGNAQSTRLVTTSLYACCRHPMTFGYSVLPCGMGIMFKSPAMTFLIPAIVFVVMIIWLKLWEEPRLERRFGQVYRDYKRQTPFLVPRFKLLMIDLASSVSSLLRRQKTEPVKEETSEYVHARHRAHNSMENDQRQKARGKASCFDTLELLNEERIRVFQRRVLRWYTRHGRDLPWRHTRDPYRILVAEIMLHQTQVDRVIPKYHEWLTVYPTFEALAAARLEEAKKLWRPLGYNYRPERLHQIARYVVNELDGKLPETFEELIALPGIGRYTAGAVLSFAFHHDVPIVDTNIRRVIQRVFDVHGDSTRSAVNQAIWRLAEVLIPKGNAATFHHALMDFGALVCTARNPACHSCKANDICLRSAGR